MKRDCHFGFTFPSFNIVCMCVGLSLLYKKVCCRLIVIQFGLVGLLGLS